MASALADLAARESRLEARLIVLGFDNVDELDEYIYRNGAAQLIPNLQNQETQETQFNLDPQQKLERYKKVRIDMRTMKELLKTKDKEEEYLKKLLKAEKEKTGDRLRELELLRGEIERLRRNSGTFEDSSLLKVELEEKSVRLQISNDHNTLLSAEVDSLKQKIDVLEGGIQQERVESKEAEMKLANKLLDETSRRKKAEADLAHLNLSLVGLVKLQSKSVPVTSSPQGVLTSSLKLSVPLAIIHSDSSEVDILPASAVEDPQRLDYLPRTAPSSARLDDLSSTVVATSQERQPSQAPSHLLQSLPLPAPTPIIPPLDIEIPQPTPVKLQVQPVGADDSGFGSNSKINPPSTIKKVTRVELLSDASVTNQSAVKTVKSKTSSILSSGSKMSSSQKGELHRRTVRVKNYVRLSNEIKLMVKKCKEIEGLDSKFREWFEKCKQTLAQPPYLSEELRKFRLPPLEELLAEEKSKQLGEFYELGQENLKQSGKALSQLKIWRAEAVRSMNIIRTPKGVIRHGTGRLESPPGSTPSLRPKRSSNLAARTSQLDRTVDSPSQKLSPEKTSTPFESPSSSYHQLAIENRLSPRKTSSPKKKMISPKKVASTSILLNSPGKSYSDETQLLSTPRRVKIPFDLFPDASAAGNSGVKDRNSTARPIQAIEPGFLLPFHEPSEEPQEPATAQTLEAQMECFEPSTASSPPSPVGGDVVDVMCGEESAEAQNVISSLPLRSSVPLSRERSPSWEINEIDVFGSLPIKKESTISPKNRKRQKSNENIHPNGISTSSAGILMNGFYSEEEEEPRPKKKSKKSKRNGKDRENIYEPEEERIVEPIAPVVADRTMMQEIWANRKVETARLAAEKFRNSVPAQRVIELNPDRNQGQTFHYNEVVRNKAERKQMFGGACASCEAYHRKAYGLPAPPCDDHVRAAIDYSDGRQQAMNAQLQNNSRHRAQQRPEPDPPGYWEMGFPSTQQQERIRAQVAENQREKRAYQESEAAKPNGLYRYKKV